MAVYNITNNAHSVSELYPDQQYQESFVFMDEKEYEYFEERTAIMEYEGGLKKEHKVNQKNDNDYTVILVVVQMPE